MSASRHPVMLCQPDGHKSCGACCGLYNWRDHSREALADILEMQTGLFFSLKDYSGFEGYRTRRNALIRNTRLFDTIYNCEFLGFIDSGKNRIGCMLHPEVTGDSSLRNHCFYGAKICNEHFCPSFSCLTTAQQAAVVNAVHDWYAYGLVITDIDFVKDYFTHIENRIGETIKQERLSDPGVVNALEEYFALKVSWPFKSSDNRLGKYYFSEAEYHVARIDYEQRWGVPVSPYDRILVSLESALSSEAELRQAEKIIEDAMRRFVTAYTAQEQTAS